MPASRLRVLIFLVLVITVSCVAGYRGNADAADSVMRVSQVTGTTSFATIQAAYDDPATRDADSIQSGSGYSPEDLVFDRPLSVSLTGGSDSSGNFPSRTWVNSLTISDGTVTIGNIALASSDPWASVASAIQSSLSNFPGGLAVEIMTPDGVVYSGSFGGFTNTNYVPVASASKMVSATLILRLVEQGVLSLDTKTKELLPWTGYMGEIKLRHLLSFTSGINGSIDAAEDNNVNLAQAVDIIYNDQSSTASAPGSYFYYGSTHLMIAGRMAEIATGSTWRQLFYDYLGQPLGWSLLSNYGMWGNNPNPAGNLACTGLEYTRFLMLQLRMGLDGTTRLLSEAGINQQRQDALGSTIPISYSPYTYIGKVNHYGFGNWLETDDGQAPSETNPVSRWSSTGKFGWAPWVASDSSYAGIIMTRQPDQNFSFAPSEDLKTLLEPLIREALATNPPVIRFVP